MRSETSATYEIVAGPPDIATYLELRRLSGLSSFTAEAAARALPGTYYSALARHRSGAIVGMGRIIGDGGCFFQIVDILVLEAHRGQGLAKRIMANLMAHLRAHAPPSAYVSLIADTPANKLYEQFGFRETAPRSLGMAQTLW